MCACGQYALEEAKDPESYNMLVSKAQTSLVSRPFQYKSGKAGLGTRLTRRVYLSIFSECVVNEHS